MAQTSVVRAAGFIVYRLIDSEIQYLLLQSSKKPFHWTPPKGHLEKGETDLEAAFRETNEEAGIPQDVLRVLDTHIPLEYTVERRPKIVTYWIAELIDKDFAIQISHEHQDFSWAEYGKARELVSYGDAQKLLDRCHSIINEAIQSNV